MNFLRRKKTDPYCAWVEIANFKTEVNLELSKSIERVRALHVKEEKDGDAFCTACVHHEEFNWWQMWPCDTIKALDGETA